MQFRMQFYYLMFILLPNFVVAQDIIPYPQQVSTQSGSLQLTSSSRIVYTNSALRPLANILKEDLRKVTGLDLNIVSGSSINGDIELGLDGNLADEGYTMDVNSKIVIRGKDYRGVVWGASSLLQAVSETGALARVSINDAPDTDYRGLMVDLARQWHPVQNLEDIINMCRMYKIKYLHLHIMDNDGFTFPSQAYPLLPNPGRSYTLDEMHALEAYSQARGVTIIPEVEVPGHAKRMIQTYPDLFGSGTRGAINFAREDVRQAIGTIIGEVADVFKATPYIHLGCDEVDLSETGEHPDYISEIQRQDVGDIHGLFNFFISEMNGYVKAQGKRSLVWEGFNPKRTGNAQVDKDVIACPFDNYGDAGNEYAEYGHDVLNTSWYPLYLIGSTYVPAEKIYDWELDDFGRYGSPYPFSHNNPYQYKMTHPDQIIGAQTCSWEQKAEWEIPSLRGRISPMSERVWNRTAGKTFADFQDRYQKTDATLQAILATAVPEVITPSASFEIFPDKVSVQWKAEGQYPDGYTLYRSTSNNSGSATAILRNTTATQYSDTDVTAGQTYYYWIKAHNSVGTSGFGGSADGRVGASNLVDLYEPFDYAAGTRLNSQNGGKGFDGGWSITKENGRVEVVPNGLTYPNLKTSGGSLAIDLTSATDDVFAQRPLAGSFTPEGSEVWVSFLVKANKVAIGHCFISFGDGRVGKKWGNGIYFGGVNAQRALDDGVTNLVVLKIENLAGADKVHVWTNPVVDGVAPSTNDPNYYFTDRTDVKTNPRLLLNVQHHGEGSYEVDEFRIGDTFDDVLPTSGEVVVVNNGPCPAMAQDDFDYPAGRDLAGASGGTGFGNSAWTMTDQMNGSIAVQSGSLNNGVGNKVRFTMSGENSTKSVSRILNQPFTSGEEMWMSFLVQPIKLENGGFWIKPNNRQDIAVGKRWGTNFSIDNNSSNVSAQENTLAKLVVRYKLEGNQTVAHLWVNRDSDFTEANADATKTVGAIASISSLTVAMERWDDGIMELDALSMNCGSDTSTPPPPSCNVGAPCNDNNVCTINDVLDVNCNCAGTYQDSDSDGLCDNQDPCPTSANNNCNDIENCDRLLPQQQVPVHGEGKMLIIRGVDPATHTWQDTDDDLKIFIDSLDAYVRATSFNRASMVGELTPVYNFTVVDGNNGIGAMVDQLRPQAERDGYDLDSYNVIGYIHNSTTDFGGAGALGSGSNFKGTLYANNNLTWFYKGNIHEVYHTLSVGHAEAIEGGENIFPGTVPGGADPYHFMGSEGNGGLQSDIPNYMKYYLGWIDQSEVHCVATVENTCITKRIYEYSLVKNYNAQHDYAVQVGDNLWLSYEPQNANTRIERNGVLFHYIPGPGSEVTRLLDMNPNSISGVPAGVSSSYAGVVDFWDAAMIPGQSFNYEGIDISIARSGGSGEARWVDIEFCDCTFVSGDDDNDGVCNALDQCANADDNVDADSDGVPDACDTCPLSSTDDANGDNICDNLQCLQQSLEDFNYSPGSSIDNANGGAGFTNGAWRIPDAMNGSIETRSGSLSYNGQSSSGNKLRFTLQGENATKYMQRDLGYAYQNREEAWISCLIQPINLVNAGFWIKPNNRQDIAIGKKWGDEFSIDNNTSGVKAQQNVVSKLVARYKLEEGRTVVHLWVNRDDNFTDANADATKVGGVLTDLSSLVIAMERFDDGIIEIDELNIYCGPDNSNNGCNVGQICNDNNACTINDVYDANCNCIGTIQDSDGDGVCDANDICPNGDDKVDSDNDGIPDACDGCSTAGQACDDGNPCTTNDVIDPDCNCSGTLIDVNNNGICDSNEQVSSDACASIDFAASQLVSYGGSQDNGSGAVMDNGYAITVHDNGWKAVAFDYNVTPQTVLQFSFKSSVQGEEHSIGFDNDLLPSSPYRFKLYGTQNNTGTNETYNNYNGSGNYQQFIIPVGAHYTGQMSHLFFVTDMDASPQTSESYFSNVKVFEDLNGNGINDDCGDVAACTPGTTCDDGDTCTINDVYDANCNCVGTFQDSDGDGICDADETNTGGGIQDQYFFDAGTATSPLEPGYLRLTESTQNATYGWTNTSELFSLDREKGNDLNRDLVYSRRAKTFEAVVRNGQWEVVVTFGDYDYMHDQMQVAAEGEVKLTNITANIAQPLNQTFLVNVSDEKLSLQFSDLGGADANWTINRIILRRMGDACSTIGQSCDDSDACTINDVYDANCNCVGTFQDSDGDGICDADETNTGGDNSGSTDCLVYDSQNIETTWGIWNDGGLDASRGIYADAVSGERAFRIRDNSGAQSSVFSDIIDMSEAESATVTFSFVPRSMEAGEDFLIEVSRDGGSNYTEVKSWVSGTNMTNGTLYTETVAIGNSQLSARTRIRFRCDASTNSDIVYIDDITIETCGQSTGSACTPGTVCDDGDACTTGDSYDANCNCVGTFQDSDGDGICDANDTNGGSGNGNDCFDYNTNDFETGWGIWNDGGVDASRAQNDQFANSGIRSVRLRDNNGNSSAMFTDRMNLSSATSMDIEFSFLPNSMERGEDFLLEVSSDGGTTYSTLESWVAGTNMTNGTRVNVKVNIPQSAFSTNTVLRLRCDASTNYDQIFVDDVKISACGQVSLQEPDAEVANRSRQQTEQQFVEENVDELSLFPNPAHSLLNVILTTKTDVVTRVQILTTDGRLLKDFKQIDGNKLELNINDLKSEAAYILRVETSSGYRYYKRFVKI